MKLLLDTHMLLWAAVWPDLLPKKARELLADEKSNVCFFSPVSVWEVAIKRGRGRPGFDIDARVLRRQVLEGGGMELRITSAHAMAVGDLPSIHKDPFDRLLLAQAREEGLTLLTADATMAKYPIPLLYIPKRQHK